ncbi:hypothetical protein [Emticicia sp.]|uniref:hypothetical protein n=1 Tax=Emticicia sp. TaxID=1930953 RepID=UPI003750BA4F
MERKTHPEDFLIIGWVRSQKALPDLKCSVVKPNICVRCDLLQEGTTAINGISPNAEPPTDFRMCGKAFSVRQSLVRLVGGANVSLYSVA